MLQLKHRHHELMLFFTTGDYTVNLFPMISDQIRMKFRLEQHNNFDPQGTGEEEEEEEGLGI